MSRRAELGWGALGVAGALLLWAVVAAATDRPAVLPGPMAVVDTLIVRRADLAVAAAKSFSRVVIGWGAAALVAVPLGWAMGARPAFGRELSRALALVRPIPPFAWLPLVLLWVGIGEGSARLICFAGAVFPILTQAHAGVAEAPPALVAAGRNLGAGGLLLFSRVQVPAALPRTFTGLRLGWTLAWMSVVAAELVGADGGLGQLILDCRNLARPDLALAGMGVLGAVATASGAVLGLVERRVVRG